MMAPKVLRGLAVPVVAACSLAIACLAAAANPPPSTTSSTSTATTTTTTTSKTSSTPTSSHWVGVAQTVVVSTSATGKPSGTPRVFTQFSANGNGPATLKVPMSSSGFRNLSGLGKPPITDGYAVWNLHLNGPTSQRFIAHFASAKLPVQVSVAYELDGKKVEAKDIVGKTGELKVTYTVTNTTTKSTRVTFTNVLGSKETTTLKAPLPIAGDLSVTIPADFTNVKAPGASASGNGNGTSTAAWTLFLFDPLGGVKQSVTYQAHVTNAVVPSATLEAEVLPPASIPPLPAIKEPGAPAVPTVTLGRNLAALQVKLQAELAKLRAKASAALSAFKQVAVPGVQAVSRGSADLEGGLNQAAAGAANASILATDVKGGLDQAAGDAAAAASEMRDLRTRLEALPPVVRATPGYRALHARVVVLEARLTAHAIRLTATTARAGELGNVLSSASTELAGLGPRAGDLSAKAGEAATNLAKASLAQRKRQPRTIHPKQVGGGAHLDAAFGQLDAAITDAANKVDSSYAYLKALDKRAARNKLPAGNAIGATVQAGAFVYSISGANNSSHQSHLATFIGGFVLILGLCFGIGLYRIRRGMPSSLKPPKSAPAAAKG